MTAIRLAEAPPRFARPAADGSTWDVAWPRPDGPWPVRLRRPGSGEPAYGIYDPETDDLRPVDPKEDEALPGLAPTLARGRLVAYRPGRRATVRIGGTPPAYAKVVRPRRAAAVAERARVVATALGGRPGAPAVPGLVDVDLVVGVLVFAEAPGRSLHPAADAEAIGRVAASLVELHAVDAAGLGLPTDGGVSLGQYVRLAADAFPDRAAFLRAALQQVTTLPRSRQPDERLLHGDLHDKNVVLGRRGVTLLDLDLARPGSPSDDVGNLAAHLVLRSLQAGEGRGAGRRAARSLVDAYRRAGGSAADDAVRRAMARTLLRLACLYQFRRRWQPLVPALAEEATRWTERWRAEPSR